MNDNNTYNSDDLLRHLAELTPAGFTLDSDNEFIKSENGMNICLIMPTTKYYPFSVMFNGLSCLIGFEEINTVFNNVCQQTNNIPFKGPRLYCFQKAFKDDVIGQSEFLKLRRAEVVDDFSFELIKPKLTELINASIEWCSQHNTIQKFYDWFEPKQLDDMIKCFYGQLPVYRMIVKGLLNTADYDDYSDDLIDYYQSKGDINTKVFLEELKIEIARI